MEKKELNMDNFKVIVEKVQWLQFAYIGKVELTIHSNCIGINREPYISVNMYGVNGRFEYFTFYASDNLAKSIENIIKLYNTVDAVDRERTIKQMDAERKAEAERQHEADNKVWADILAVAGGQVDAEEKRTNMAE